MTGMLRLRCNFQCSCRTTVTSTPGNEGTRSYIGNSVAVQPSASVYHEDIGFGGRRYHPYDNIRCNILSIVDHLFLLLKIP